MTTFFRPLGKTTCQSVAITPWGNGLLLVGNLQPLVFNFSGGVLTQLSLTQFSVISNALNIFDVIGLYSRSSTGLPAGAVWNDGGLVAVVPGLVPNPLAPPVLISSITPQGLLMLGGGNLPLIDPNQGLGQLWNNANFIDVDGA